MSGPRPGRRAAATEITAYHMTAAPEDRDADDRRHEQDDVSDQDRRDVDTDESRRDRVARRRTRPNERGGVRGLGAEAGGDEGCDDERADPRTGREHAERQRSVVRVVTVTCVEA